MRSSVWGAVVVTAALALSACVPPAPSAPVARVFDPDTLMGMIQERGSLRVGFSPDSPTTVGGGPGPLDSLAEDFASYVALRLRVDLELVEVPRARLLTGIETGDIDIAFPFDAVTEKKVRRRTYTEPYFVGHQRVLAPPSVRVRSLEDLAAARVCSLIDPDTGLDPTKVEPTIDVTRGHTAIGCLQDLVDGRAAAVVAPDAVLAALLEELPSACGKSSDCPADAVVTGDQSTTEAYAALVPDDFSGWVEFLNLRLIEWKQEGWTESYDENLRDALGPQDPPTLSIEEAASLFPDR